MDDCLVVDLDARRPHAVGVATCHDCGHQQISIVVAEVAEAPLQCARCKSMACALVSPEGP